MKSVHAGLIDNDIVSNSVTDRLPGRDQINGRSVTIHVLYF